jgi:hypothetical protein
VRAIYFNWAYVQKAANYQKDQPYLIEADFPASVGRISSMFHNSPRSGLEPGLKEHFLSA